MGPSLDERSQNILYHALGANFEQGLQLFENAFEEAEYGFRLNEIESLLGILADSTLQDQRLSTWHRYFSARRDILLWQPEQAEIELQALAATKDQGSAAFTSRLELLRAQICALRGDSLHARNILSEITTRAATETRIRVIAYEWLAQSLMAQVVSSGGWAKQTDSSVGRILNNLVAFILLPAYLVVMLLRGSARWLPIFWKAISRHAANYTNWPTLVATLDAYRALEESQELAVEDKDARRRQTELLRAEVLRFAENTSLSARIYQKLLKANDPSKDPYLGAVLNLGYARVQLMANKIDINLASQLEQARQTFLELHDQHSMASVTLLLGDIDLKAGLLESAVEKWKTAMQTFQVRGDSAGVAECLGRCYSVLSLVLTEDQRHTIETVVQEARLRAFSVRLPNPFFRALQNATWLIPLLGGLGSFVGIAAYLAMHERTEYRMLANIIFSPKGLLIGCTLLLAMILSATILGWLGLLSTLHNAATRLEWFTVDKDRLIHQSSFGPESSFDLTNCRRILKVERAFGISPTDSLSFTLLEWKTGEKLVIPGATTWYRYLQETVVAISGVGPSVYQLKLYWGLIFVFIGFIFPFLFLLIDLSLQPWLSVQTHADLVTIGQILAVLLILWVSIGWIWHFAQVYFETAPRFRFANLTASAAIILILLAVFGRKLLFPLDLIVLSWGIALLAAFAWLMALTLGSPGNRQLVRIGSHLVMVVGLVALLYRLIPLLLHTQAYIYAGAIQKLQPAQLNYEVQRADYFAKMRIRSEQILRLDPSYRQAYAFLGLALQAQGDLSNSLKAYAKYHELSDSTDILHCTALVHYLLGEREEALQEYTIYLSGKEDPLAPDYCDRYFPEMRGVLSDLE